MKKTERTGKAFYMKWLLLAVVAMALIFMPAASQKVSASKLVYTVKFNNNSGTSTSKTYTVTDKKCYAEYHDQASGSSESCRLSESWMDHDRREAARWYIKPEPSEKSKKI